MSCSESQKILCNNDDCQICFNRSFASHPKSKYWSRSNNFSPRQVFLNKYGSVKYLFDCEICGHIFEKNIDKIKAGTWCQYCSNQKLCENNNCTICFDKSFASHPKAVYWHSDNKISPRNVFKGTLKKYKFNCCECYHTIEISLNKITSSNRWCKYCSNNVLCDDNNCQTCFNKSFASHPKSKFWNSENKVSPRKISKISTKEYSFNCNSCGHQFSIIIRHINHYNSWCKYCSNTKLCKNDNCETCFEKSFASHSKSKFWHSDNEVSPRQVFLHSHKKYKFKCDSCDHVFNIALHGILANSWCNYCSHTKLCKNNNC